MIQPCRCLGLLREALQIRRTDGDVFRKELESNEAVQLCVLGFVDDTHSPLTKLFENLVVRNCFSDHRIRLRHKDGGSSKFRLLAEYACLSASQARREFWDIPPPPSLSRIL